MRWNISRYLGSGMICTGLFLSSGCGQNCEHACCGHDHSHGTHETVADEAETDADATGHTHTGPNGGRLIVLGDEDYHAELVIDHTKGEVTVRVLDKTGRKPVGIEQRTITLNF